MRVKIVDKQETIKAYISKANEINKYVLEASKLYPKEAGQHWTTELDDELTVMYCEGVHVKDMAKHFGGSKGAILRRIKKLEMEKLYE